jgi:hypothetical protein
MSDQSEDRRDASEARELVGPTPLVPPATREVSADGWAAPSTSLDLASSTSPAAVAGFVDIAGFVMLQRRERSSR